MLVLCVVVVDELRAAVVVLSVERAEEVWGDDVSLAGADEGDREESTGFVETDEVADTMEDAAFEVSEAIDDSALESADGAEDGALMGVVAVDVAGIADEDGMTKVGSWDGVLKDDWPTGALDAEGGTIPGVIDGNTTPGVYDGMTPGVVDSSTPGVWGSVRTTLRGTLGGVEVEASGELAGTVTEIAVGGKDWAALLTGGAGTT
jgi:hypothetical protein